MLITILTDNKKSWFVPYGKDLEFLLINKGNQVNYVFSKEDIGIGDICFILSCTKLIETQYLEKNNHNIVVHASDLPKGKGFSPMQWQIIEGENEIILTLFEVVEQIDAGPYYSKDKITLDGTELYEEIRHKMALKIIEMCSQFVSNYDNLKPIQQIGDESFYPRRRKKDDEIDPYKTIADQFNHFRIADNDNFPLYFWVKGRKYYLKITTEPAGSKSL